MATGVRDTFQPKYPACPRVASVSFFSPFPPKAYTRKPRPAKERPRKAVLAGSYHGFSFHASLLLAEKVSEVPPAEKNKFAFSQILSFLLPVVLGVCRSNLAQQFHLQARCRSDGSHMIASHGIRRDKSGVLPDPHPA